ncbi:MAG: gamma-glutamyltransferase family protein [Actinomycetes bacterium]
MTTGPRTGRAARYPRAALATPHHLASAAGAGVLARGGNAVDAIIAANLALGVVAPYLCGYGGDLFAIVWDGSLHGYLGSGRSGGAATPTRLRSDGHTAMPTFGGASVTIPGAVAGWFDLHARWASMPMGTLTTDARRYAEGFALTRTGAETIAASAVLHGGSAPWRAVYGNLADGDVLRQPGLVRLIDALVADGPDAYYRGPVADAIADAVGRDGGHLDAADLAGHAGEWAAPLRAAYRDREVAELGPPTQGVTALEILRILDGFDLAAMATLDVEHTMIEATKLALADREAHVSDPAAMRIDPHALLADEYVAGRRAAIDPTRAADPAPGRPQRGGTAYLCAVDRDGLAVSLIQSNFLGFGSGVHVPDWGINLTNRGSSFTLDESAVNVLAPSKRPMHTLIPGMVLRDGRPDLVFGSMGADAQAQVHAQVLRHIVDRGADPQAAIDAPRWRVELGDWGLRHETRFDAELVAALAARGHRLTPTAPYDMGMGHAHAIRIESAGLAVASDPRSEGAAVGR